MLINSTRVTIPPLKSKILHRERLLSLLKRSLEKKLTVIAAGAGEGKTTLVLDFINESRLPTVWYSLTPSDSDLFRFLAHLELALHKVFPKYKQGTVTRHFSSISSLSLQIDQVADMLAAKLNEIVSTSLLVILDDYHRLYFRSNVHSFLAKLLEYSSPKVHFIIITRRPLHEVFVKFYLRREAFEITKDDLRFTLQETYSLFTKVFSCNFEKNRIEKIARICEGWITAILLMCENLESLDAEAEILPAESLDKFCLYLGEEIFKKLPSSTQTVLLKTCTLEEVHSEIARELSGFSKAKDILDKFTKNFFLATRIDSETYRYHHLLRLFLQSKLSSREIKKLHLKAASYYQAKGNNLIAIHHILQGGCTKRAARLLEREAWNILMKGQHESLALILKKFCAEDFQNHPWLLYFRAWLNRWEKPQKALQDLKTAIDLFIQKGNNRGVALSLQIYVEINIMSGNMSPKTSRLINQIMQTITSKKKLPLYLSSYILLSISMLKTFCRGDFQRGLELAQTAYKYALKVNNLDFQIKALVIQGFVHYYKGEIEDALEIAEKLSRLIEKRQISFDLRLYIFHLAGMACLLKGNVAKVKEFLDKYLKIVRILKAESLYPFIWDTLVHVHIAQRQYFEAEKSILKLKNIGEETQNILALTLAQTNLLCLYLLTERLDKALNLVPDLLEISKKAGNGYFSVLARVLILSTYVEAGKREEALKILRSTLLRAKKIGAKYLISICHGEAAKLYFDLGKKRLFIRHLRSCLKLICDHSYRYFCNYRDSLYAFIAYQSFRQGIYPEVGKDIIVMFLGRNAINYLSPYLKEAEPEVRKQLQKLIKKAFRYSAPSLYIKTLGDFEVKVGNRIITQWKSQKAKTLLKILVAQGKRPIPIEMIAENLWPEGNWASVKENFKITLRRLRRSLEPGLPLRMNSSYVHLKNNCLYLDKDKVLVDAWKFKNEVKDIISKERKSFIQEDIEKIENIISLYKGDFLPQDLYNDWASREREYLKNLYLKLIKTAINLTKDYHRRLSIILCPSN